MYICILNANIREIMKLKNISIVCVYNNEYKLKNILLKSLAIQKKIDFELILIDNSDNKFCCASKALNNACRKAKEEFILIIHQDIMFKDEYELYNILVNCNKLENFGVIGIAGRSFNPESDTITSITDRIPEKECSSNKVKSFEVCQTLDECLFVIRRKDYMRHPFDEFNKSWHLYAVEYCIEMILLGKTNYVINSSVYHVSNANSLDETYFVELLRFIKTLKKNKNINTLYTTCGIWRFRNFFCVLNIILIFLKEKIKTFMRKHIRNK